MSEGKSRKLIQKIDKLHQEHCNSKGKDAMPKSRKPPRSVPGRPS